MITIEHRAACGAIASCPAPSSTEGNPQWALDVALGIGSPGSQKMRTARLVEGYAQHSWGYAQPRNECDVPMASARCRSTVLDGQRARNANRVDAASRRKGCPETEASRQVVLIPSKLIGPTARARPSAWRASSRTCRRREGWRSCRCDKHRPSRRKSTPSYR